MARHGMTKKEANGGASSISSHAELPSPFGELRCELSREDLRDTAYEIFVGSCRVTGGRPLTYISQAEKAAAGAAVERSLSATLSSSSSPLSASPSLHRSLTSSAAHQFKRALGLKSKKDGSSSKTSKKQLTVPELMRIQMGISEQTDARIRRGLLRISAGQLGRRIDSMILPLEMLQKLKPSDFPDEQEHESCQARYLKILEAGLILHPHLPSDRSDPSSQKLRQIIHRAQAAGIDSESMDALRSSAMAVASRSSDGSATDKFHWADGSPLNLHFYDILLESCFDHNDGSIIDEADEIIEQMKKTWPVLGMNQSLHNLCFMWALFKRLAEMGDSDPNLVMAAENQLSEVAEDAKTTKDPVYSKMLTLTLTSVMNWAEQRLLAYHDTFHSGNVDLMKGVLSLGVSSAKIMEEGERDSPHHRRKRREEVDVTRSRVDGYIRSSLRTAFAEMMERAASSRRSMKNRSSPVLCILARDVSSLANKEKELFSPVLNAWHPLAAAVAMSTLHVCYGRELKQFIAGVTELTSDAVSVLKAADELERELVQIAVEDSAESDDGGKAIIREMPPFEAGSTMARLARTWISQRVDSVSQLIARLTQGIMEDLAPAVDLLRTVEAAIDDFFQLPIPMHHDLLPDLLTGLDKNVDICISRTKHFRGEPGDFLPQLPPLTRCADESRLWRKKDKPQKPHKTQSQADTSALTKLCAAINTFHNIRCELDRLEKKCGGGGGAATARFDLSSAACREAIQHLCEIAAARVIFVDLSHVVWDTLFLRDGPTMTRTGPLIKELDLVLERLASSLHSRVRNRAVTALMKTCFDGFLLVLLAGGSGRRFTAGDAPILEEEFKAIRELFLADGDGLPGEVVEKAAKQARDVLPLFGEETGTLILRYKKMMEEKYGGGRGKMPMPPTTERWSSGDPNTLLRVLCYRDDEAASKFLKKTYGLPKKL